jgi:hypothetical protein
MERGKVHGTNLDFIEKSIPHIWKVLLPTLDHVIRRAEVLVVMQQLTEDQRSQFHNMSSAQICIDLARTLSPENINGEYWTMDRTPKEILAFSFS